LEQLGALGIADVDRAERQHALAGLERERLIVDLQLRDRTGPGVRGRRRELGAGLGVAWLAAAQRPGALVDQRPLEAGADDRDHPRERLVELGRSAGHAGVDELAVATVGI